MYAVHVSDMHQKEIRNFNNGKLMTKTKKMQLEKKISKIREDKTNIFIKKEILNRNATIGTGEEDNFKAGNDRFDLKMVRSDDDDDRPQATEVHFTDQELRAIKKDEDLKIQLFNAKTFKVMPSYVFNQLVTNKRTRDFIAEKLSRKALDDNVFLKECDLDIALEYCDRELFS